MKVQAANEDNNDVEKFSCLEELKRVFNQFHTCHIQTLLDRTDICRRGNILNKEDYYHMTLKFSLSCLLFYATMRDVRETSKQF